MTPSLVAWVGDENALAGIGAAQEAAAKRQKLMFFVDLDAKGLLNAEQKGKLTAALDKQLDSLN